MLIKQVTLKQAQAICRGRRAAGKWFGVDFIKRGDGSKRRMCARGGVTKGVTGEGLKFDPAKHRIMGIYDRVVRGHRFIDLDAITEVRIKGTRYVVVEKPC